MAGQQMDYEIGQWTAKAADSYQELARLFGSYVMGKGSGIQEGGRMAKRLEERLCTSCPKKEWCTTVFEKEQKSAFFQAVQQVEEMGKMTMEWVPEYFLQECMRLEELEETINLAVDLERTRQSAYNQMMEGKEALVFQLEETARYFRQFQQSLQRAQYLTAEQKKELVLFLRRYHLKAGGIETNQRNGKGRELCMGLRCDGAKRTMSLRLVERLLSEKLGFPVKAYGQARGYLTEDGIDVLFREVPRYSVRTGVARMVKEEQKVSGDSFSFFYEEEGEMAMILSDGMGSGEEAAKESESVLLLLERLLSAGFKEESAIRLINSVLALRVEQKMFATLDISRINLYSGTCEFIKIGSAATYLRSGNWLECVEAKTLPIGMVQQVDYDFLVKKLYAGDYIIMMSDGVLDAVPEQERAEFLRQIMGDEPEQSPQVLAGRILNASLLVQNFEPRDDMTVLVCGVFEEE